MERAASDLDIACFGVTVDNAALKLAVKCVRNALLEDWKRGKVKPEFGGVKFQSESPNVPEVEQVPEMTICKLIGDSPDVSLAVPTDIRQKYLADPVHAPEWRTMLKNFDKKHGIPVPGQSAAASASQSQEQPAQSNFAWDTIFAGDPKTIKDLESKFSKIAATFALDCGDGLVCYVCEGPQMYLAAPNSAGTCPADELLLGHGAGNWLLDQRAAKALQDLVKIICGFDNRFATCYIFNHSLDNCCLPWDLRI